jgi:histidinol-phosphatase (PHP family)
MLPLDGHVHSEWSWDTTKGSMAETCARAVELGLSAIAFTEHADPLGGWAVLASDLDDYPSLKPFVDYDRPPGDPVGGTLKPPPLDVSGYVACVQECRDRFADVRILMGLELGEPHRDPAAAEALIASADFEWILGSLHSLADGAGFSEMPNLFRERAASDVVRAYLAELIALIEGSDVFSVLGHIDYVLRYWPESAGPFRVGAFEEEFRSVLRALGETERALEVNTRLGLPTEVVQWWREEGGRAVVFGSDAHDASGLARDFQAATQMVEAAGFYPGRRAEDPWTTTLRPGFKR